MSFTRKVAAKKFYPRENCGTDVANSTENLCNNYMKTLYNEPLNKPKLRKCRRCGRKSTNYFYCHEHSIKDGEDNDFLNYEIVVKLNSSNRRHG